jgi:hypothetical protein
MRHLVCSLLLLATLGCDKPSPPAEPTPAPQETPAPPPAPPRPDPLATALQAADETCHVVGSTGSRPANCDPALQQIEQHIRTLGPAALAHHATPPPRDPKVRAWLLAQHLPPITRALRLTPDARAPLRDHAAALLLFVQENTSGAHPAAAPVSHLAGLYDLPTLDDASIYKRLIALNDPDAPQDDSAKTLLNLTRASTKTHRLQQLPTLKRLLDASPHDAPLAHAALEALWEMAPWSPDEATAVCALLHPADSKTALDRSPPAQYPIIALRLSLACEPDAQRAALRSIERSAKQRSLDPQALALLAERCSPSPYHPWPPPLDASICDPALALVISTTRDRRAPTPLVVEAAAALAKGWPDARSQAALKALARDKRPEVAQQAKTSLQTIELYQEVRRTMLQRAKNP